MKYHTNIDTIGIQIDASTIEEQNMIRFMLCRAIWNDPKLVDTFLFS